MPVYEVRSPVRLLNFAWNYFSWPKLEKITGKADLYHVAGMVVPPTRYAKVLQTVHGIIAEVMPELLPLERVRRLKKVLRDAMRRADYYLAISESTKKDMIEYLGVDPALVFVVPHGVDPIFRYLPDREDLKNRLRRRFGITRPYVLYVGAIGHHKNVMGILHAYRLIREIGFEDYELWLVGPQDSAWEEVIEFRRKNNMEDWIFIPGLLMQNNQELTDLYNGADCFVFPSYYEGSGLPPLEAIACGTPVIISNRSSLPEMVGDAALFVDPDEPEELANQVALLLQDDDLRAAMIEKGFRRVKEVHWRFSAMRLIEVYKKIEEQM